MEADTTEASIISDLKAGRFKLSRHARVRMAERGVDRLDIISVGQTAFHSEPQENGNILVCGVDTDSDSLDVVCAYDGETLVVTVK